MTKTLPITSNSILDSTSATRVVLPCYIQLLSSGLSKRILNHLRSKCNAGAGVAAPAFGSVKVQTATVSNEQAAMEQRLGVSLNILRDLLMSRSDGLKLDLVLRIQRECDFVFLDEALLDAAFQNSKRHFLAHAGLDPREFAKLKYNYSEEI